ncbi:MAG: hypothetical protein ACK5DD_03305 [Cyclobacteriaceae bacterium]
MAPLRATKRGWKRKHGVNKQRAAGIEAESTQWPAERHEEL